MSSKTPIMRGLRALGVEDPATFAPLTKARLIRRRIRDYDGKIRRAYLSEAAEPKLHIGGGWRKLDGWLNSDLALVPGVIHMDATCAFPLPSEMFAFVFSEHMIEHVPYEAGLFMLRECFRVLQPGGVIRLVTPDLRAIAALFDEPRSQIQHKYFNYFREQFVPADQPAYPAALANAMFRLWGHAFIYDEETLNAALQTAGFMNVKRYRLGDSGHQQLRCLENESRYPPGLLNYESIAVEAVKPSGSAEK